MRSLRTFTEPEKQKIKFTYYDLTNCLFYNQPPVHTFHPFKYLSPQSLRSLSLTAKVFLSDPPLIPKLLLEKHLFAINGNEIKDTESWKKITPWMLSAILIEIKRGVKAWKNYIVAEMDDYCKTFDSLIQWSYVKQGGVNQLFPAPSPEQKYWLTANDYLDKQDIYTYVDAVKESILPWLDLQLWKNVKKKKENTRTNIDYERQRKEFIERSIVDEESLDIIK